MIRIQNGWMTFGLLGSAVMGSNTGLAMTPENVKLRLVRGVDGETIVEREVGGFASRGGGDVIHSGLPACDDQGSCSVGLTIDGFADQACGEGFVSLAFPWMDTDETDDVAFVSAIHLAHSVYAQGSAHLYLMGDCGGQPDPNNILYEGCNAVEHPEGTIEPDQWREPGLYVYPIDPPVQTSGTTWIVVVQDGNQSFDVACNPEAPDASGLTPGMGYGNLSGLDACGEWIDLAEFGFGFCYCVSLEKAPSPIVAFGMPNVAVGQAQLELEGRDNLLISNIGSSGEDGFTVLPGVADGLCVSFTPPVCPSGYGFGTAMQLSTQGTFSQGGTWAATLQFQNNSSSAIDLNVNFNAWPCSDVSLHLNGPKVGGGFFGFTSGIMVNLPPTTCIKEVDWLTCDPNNGFRILLDAPALVTIPTWGTYTADEIRLCPCIIVGKPLSKQLLNSFEVTMTNAPDQIVGGELLEQFGVFHEALGGATITGRIDPDSGQEEEKYLLTAGNIGSSGEDGVRTYFDGAQAASIGLKSLPPGTPVKGLAMTFEPTGIYGGGGEQSLGVLSIEALGASVTDGYSVGADFFELGTDVMIVRLLDKSSPKLQEAMANPDIMVQGETTSLGLLGDIQDDHGFELVFPEDTIFIINGVVLSGDTLQLLVPGTAGLESSLSWLELRAKNAPDIDINAVTVTEAPPPPPPCEGDANGDDTVDPLDYGFVLARLGCQVGSGETDCDAADQNGDGLVDPLDGGFVQARFGECQP